MKICLISPLFDPWGTGGSEKYAKTLVEKLSDKHEFVVITTKGPTPRQQNQSQPNPKIIEITPTNIATLYYMLRNDYSVGFIKKSLWHFLDLWNLSSYVKIKNILKVEKPDLVHTNAVQGFSPSVFSAIRDLRIPHVHTLNDLQLISRWAALFRNGMPVSEMNLLDRMYVFYLSKLSANVNAVMSPSKFTMNFHEKLGYFKNSCKYIIPNGTMINTNAKPKEGPGKDFLFVGGITEFKGPSIAVKAFKKITNKNIKLHIVGNGSYLDTLKIIADKDKRIIFHGFTQGVDLDEIFNKCSCLIFPSLGYESFGLVIIEAMSRGLPVIASKIGGIPELVKDDYNGFLFEPGDVDSLQHIIETLINDKETLSKISNNAIESSKIFSIESQMKSILDVYAKTLFR